MRYAVGLQSLIFLLIAVPYGSAQGGGKAEPLRVQFKRGSTSAMMKGVVRGSEEAEYLVGARKGQGVTLRLTSNPPSSVAPHIKDPDLVELKLEYDGDASWSGTLPETGDYLISVVRATERPGASRYTFRVTIR